MCGVCVDGKTAKMLVIKKEETLETAVEEIHNVKILQEKVQQSKPYLRKGREPPLSPLPTLNVSHLRSRVQTETLLNPMCSINQI